MNEVTINSTPLSVKEYEGKRVITFKDIDTVHGRPDGTARKRFNDLSVLCEENGNKEED